MTLKPLPVICCACTFLFGLSGSGLIPQPVVKLIMVACIVTGGVGQFLPGQSVLTGRFVFALFGSYILGLVSGWLLFFLQMPT